MALSKVEFATGPTDLLGEATLVTFVDRTLSLPSGVTRTISSGLGHVARAMAEAGFRGHAGESVTVFVESGDEALRLVLVGTAVRAGDQPLRPVELGGHAAGSVGLARHVIIAAELPQTGMVSASAAAEMALGFRLRSYRFDAYRTHIDEVVPPTDRVLTVLTPDDGAAALAFEKEAALAEGVELARDLVNEPPNVLTPAEFARRTADLRNVGLEVEILGPSDLQRLGFRAVLAVGQGSSEDSFAAILRWTGQAGSDALPLAAIGKGVCFDSGGLTLKKMAEQTEMKGDMAGAAAVVGFMLSLAKRKARINAIGVIGLVENMPDGRAQKPGDIVRSLSGQTIEVLDADAEGRMVLADLLWYVQDRFAPRHMIDLATLTDAVTIGIGRDYAGLFANDDELANLIVRAGQKAGEIVWRLPLGPNFDRQIDSTFADVKNLGPEAGGGCTAANFLQRFVNGKSWAHLDIAGPAQNMPESAINTSWGTGWGVRLLDRLARDIETDRLTDAN
jgi:leucyl aminopeptidase